MDPFVKGGIRLPKAAANANSGFIEFDTVERGDMSDIFGGDSSMIEDMGIFTVDEDNPSEAPHLM